MKFILKYSHPLFFFLPFPAPVPHNILLPLKKTQKNTSLCSTLFLYLLKRFPWRHYNYTAVQFKFHGLLKMIKAVIVIHSPDYILGVNPSNLINLTDFVSKYGKFKPKNKFVLVKYPHLRL